MKIDLSKFNKFVEEKYISVQKHSDADLLIWNYTQKTQFDRVWTEETMTCRGLITDLEGNIIARPFKKFFNLEEAINNGEQLPIESFEVTEKMDGSLGILYWVNNKPYIATRGSFTSEQAIRGTQILWEKYLTKIHLDSFYKGYTYLFEIIYPENRIVVDYGKTEDLYLLAIVNTQTGEEVPHSYFEHHSIFPFVKKYDGITDIKKLNELQEDNKEGFVIHFASGKRYKVKFDEYVRLHRLVTGVNARSIWDLLRNKQPFEELLERVPDEFYAWVSSTRDSLIEQYNSIDTVARLNFHSIKGLSTRKEFAEKARTFKYPALLFSMLDQKPYDEAIWKMIRPSAERPFREDEA